MTQWLTDDIDFSAYEQDTEVRQRVLPASAFTDDVIAYSQEVITVGAAPELVKVRFA